MSKRSNHKKRLNKNPKKRAYKAKNSNKYKNITFCNKIIMVKSQTCVIQLDELLRTSKSLNKNRIDKKEYEFNVSRY